MSPIGAHQGAIPESCRWLTPPELIDTLGPFDLDPCADQEQPWPTATRMIRPPEDGLAAPWQGLVWLNPPYTSQVGEWMRRLSDHGNGIALVFARTDTEWFYRYVWTVPHPQHRAALFLRRRLHFHRPDGRRAPANSGGPSVLVSYGFEAGHRLAKAHADRKLDGAFLPLLSIGVPT